MKTLPFDKSIWLVSSLKPEKPPGHPLDNLLKKTGYFKWNSSKTNEHQNSEGIEGIETQRHSGIRTIENVKLEVAEVYSAESHRKEKALLLTICENQQEKNCFLISIQQLLSEISGLYQAKGIKHQNDDTDNFENLFHSLSLREQQVLTEVSHGKTSNEIARKFFISTNTVKNHRKNIKKKLDFPNHILYSRFLKWTVDYCEKVPTH